MQEITYPVIRQSIDTHFSAIVAMGGDPTWDFFRDSFSWFRMKKKLTLEQQDDFHEIWVQVYSKKKGVLRKTCRST